MNPIYLDYAATTPMRAEVREAMAPYEGEIFGNPSSSHRWGRQAQAALEQARIRIAKAIGAKRREIIFVRGGTESDNLAILGRFDFSRRGGRERTCVVTSATEHKAVLDAASAAEYEGGRAVFLPVDRDGVVDLDALDAALAEQPCLVSVMWVNNETGVVQPIREIVERAGALDVAVHSDAVQAIGKLPVRLDETDLSLLSLSGHKLYGPKSAGLLFVREGTELFARIHGGGQEGGLRPGTPDVAGAVGLAEAVALAVEEQEEARHRYLGFRARLLQHLRSELDGLTVHSEHGEVAGHILSVGFHDLAAETLTIALDMEGLAISGGSACQSGSSAASHVLRAMYGEQADLPATVRYSFGRLTTEVEIDEAAAATVRVVRRLRGAAAPA